MRTTTLSKPGLGLRVPSAPGTRGTLDGVAERALHLQLGKLQHGSITLVDGDRVRRFGPAIAPEEPPAAIAAAPLSATVQVHDARFYGEIVFGGSVGAGEAYMRGDWSCSDLTALARILLQNRAVLDGMDSGIGALAQPLRRALHWASRNTRTGSRRNIAAHYDLGNDFFALFLDPTMMYSGAVFDRERMSLEEASIAKLERICQKLDLKPGDHVLEIGTGWGGFAIHAASHYGCRVTTTTISREQHALARERVVAAGIEDRVTLLLEDYRDLTGRYDKLVSIEMIEAVGQRYFDTYFMKCAELLKPDGMMLLQAITIADQRYEAALHSVDFIQKRIFPGCCIPSVSVMCDAIARKTDMRLFDLEDIGLHYAPTLRCWRDNMFANIESVRALGYPDAFIRMWEFYLCYCEAGFAERATGDVQMLLVKPQARPATPLRGATA